VTKPIAACVLASLLLTACAKTVWEKPGAAQADYSADMHACERDAEQSRYPGTGLARKMIMLQVYDRCMVANGYTSLKISAPAAPSHGDPDAQVAAGVP
jgi:hypothetical protein